HHHHAQLSRLCRQAAELRDRPRAAKTLTVSAASLRLILRSGRRPRLEGWAASWFETRFFEALLTMRPREAAAKISIPIMLGLVGAADRHADVVGLVLAQFGQLDAELGEMQPRDLFVERLRQHIDLFLVLARIGEELDLRQRLVGERR